MPRLLLPHTGVTWSEQLDGPPQGTLDTQASSARKAAFKGRESVSMYLEDANKTMQVVAALRERQVFIWSPLADVVYHKAMKVPSISQTLPYALCSMLHEPA